MAAELLDRFVGLLPLLALVVFYFWWIRKANARSVEMMRINNALLEANLDMANRLRNIEALLEKCRQA